MVLTQLKHIKDNVQLILSLVKVKKILKLIKDYFQNKFNKTLKPLQKS